MQIFDLRAPILAQAHFQTRSRAPADPGGRCRSPGQRLLDAAICHAAGHIGHPVAERIADSTARGAEPVLLRLAWARRAEAKPRARAAGKVGPGGIGFDTEDHRPGLPVVTEIAAKRCAAEVIPGATRK